VQVPHRAGRWRVARLLTLKAAWMMDKYGNKEARAEIAMIKVAAPNMACRVIDWAIQAFGGAGVTGDYGLAYAYATARVRRLADGPDEVHRSQIARLELRKYQGPASLSGGSAEVLPPDVSPGLRQRPVCNLLLKNSNWSCPPNHPPRSLPGPCRRSRCSADLRGSA
jgi:hypothetical protein